MGRPAESRLQTLLYKLVKAVPSPIIEAVIVTGSICLDKRYKPIPIEQTFAKKSSVFREALGIATTLGAVVEDVRTIFERRNDATIYIPDMQSIAVLA